MYVCGPTVYNLIHIGNARPMIVFDTVRRYMEYKGYEVNYVSNFTDVDDKIIKKANEEGVEPGVSLSVTLQSAKGHGGHEHQARHQEPQGYRGDRRHVRHDPDPWIDKDMLMLLQTVPCISVPEASRTTASCLIRIWTTYRAVTVLC